MKDEPRTNLEMWRDALELLQEREFRDGYRSDWGGSYVTCDTCGATVWRPSGGAKPSHATDCKLGRVLRELEAFVRVEAALEEERQQKEE